jgi:putative ABC transport system permease protein
MKRGRLLLRNLTYYRRTNLPIIIGVAIAVAVLSGALMVGQSVRASLRRLLYERIGKVEYLVTAEHFFSEKLSREFTPKMDNCPIIYLKGVVIHEKTGIRSYDVNVYGVDDTFWKFHGMEIPPFPEERAAFVGDPLSRQLNIQNDDTLLLRIETQQTIPREWLYGRRDNVGKTLRLSCRRILPANKLGEFALRPNQGSIYSIFVPLTYLQRTLAQTSQINAILLARRAPDSGLEFVADTLMQGCTLHDLGLRLRTLDSTNGFSLESSRILIDDQTVQAALQAASALGLDTSPVYTYLANSIRSKGREIPYSVITAADFGKGALRSVKEIERASFPATADPKESIWLTDWAAQSLGIAPGQTVEVDYYVWQNEGKLKTRTARFRLAGILATTGDVDAALAPSIPGVTDAKSINTWDPPFPLDLGRIRREDEDYWNRFKATPKAFIPLLRGQELWQNRFGKLTGLRISLPGGRDLAAIQKQFAETIIKNLNPQSAGFAISPIKEQGLAASQGTTDFGEYFVYFSFFLIAAAVLLAALFFKLMIEQRVREIGTLRASGFSIRLLMRTFLYEGAILSITGALLGMLGSIGYGWLMVFGLRTWWVDAVGTRRILLQVSWPELLIGSVCGVVFSMGSLAWTLRSLRHNSPRQLLAGVLESTSTQKRRARILVIASVSAAFLAVTILIGSSFGSVSQLEAFFAAGFLLLISILCATALYLRRAFPAPIQGKGWPALLRLGFRNAMHRPGRSLFCASLIASATFIVVSMEAFRQDMHSISLDNDSGTGGYPLLAESALPILYDPNSVAGQDALGISPQQVEAFRHVEVVSFRERPGDDASCLNLYAPQEPKILGAPNAFCAAGRFSFQNSLATTPEQKSNPWLLLDSQQNEPFIPSIADANTLQYILHLSLGSELVVRGSRGMPVRLRFVGALRDSIFQGKVIISETSFLRAFPEQEGYRFFLLNTPPEQALMLIPPLKEALADYGVSIERSQERLAAYHRVENTYLSTFQSLGTLGLILGTVGLATILLRNVLERRQELALLRAVGYRMRVLSAIILAENVFLIVWGLVSGSICALLAILPALHARGASLPLGMAAYIMIAVLIAGLTSSVFAVIAAFRSPLLPALRSE